MAVSISCRRVVRTLGLVMIWRIVSRMALEVESEPAGLLARRVSIRK